MRWIRERFRWKLAVLATVALAAMGGAAFSAYAALNQVEREAQEVRWVNVTIIIPADSDMHHARMTSAPQAIAQGIMGPMLLLTDGEKSLVLIDAQTGQVRRAQRHRLGHSGADDRPAQQVGLDLH